MSLNQFPTKLVQTFSHYCPSYLDQYPTKTKLKMSKTAAIVSEIPPEYERKLLTPIKTCRTKRGNFISKGDVDIIHKDKKLYHAHATSSTFSHTTTISIHEGGSSRGTVLSSAKINSKQDGLVAFLGEADSGSEMKVEENFDEGPMRPKYKFHIGAQAYEWQSACHYSIRIPTADGASVAEETMGSDWRFVDMSSNGKIIAAHIAERSDSTYRAPSGDANLHWFEYLDEEAEKVTLAVLMGILERRRRSAKEYSSGTSLLYG